MEIVQIDPRMVRIELILAMVAVASAQYGFPPPGTPGIPYEYPYERYNPGAPGYDDGQPSNPIGPAYPAGSPYPNGPTYPQGHIYQYGPSKPSGPSYLSVPVPQGQVYPSGPSSPKGPSKPNGPSYPNGHAYPKGQSYPSGKSYSNRPSYSNDDDDDDNNVYDPNYDYKTLGLYSPGAYPCGYNDNGRVYPVIGVCFAYYECVSGQSLYRQCNDNYRFDSGSGKCVADKSCTTACPKGLYAHPNNIYKFILGGQEMDCPLGTYFDFKICTCNHNYLMPRRPSY